MYFRNMQLISYFNSQLTFSHTNPWSSYCLPTTELWLPPLPFPPTWHYPTSPEGWCGPQCPLNVSACFSFLVCCLCLFLKASVKKGFNQSLVCKAKYFLPAQRKKLRYLQLDHLWVPPPKKTRHWLCYGPKSLDIIYWDKGSGADAPLPWCPAQTLAYRTEQQHDQRMGGWRDGWMKRIAAPKVNLGEQKSEAEFLGRGGWGQRERTPEERRKKRRDRTGEIRSEETDRKKWDRRQRKTGRKKETKDRGRRQGLGGTGRKKGKARRSKQAPEGWEEPGSQGQDGAFCLRERP